jgi:hypothetical protein
MIWPGIMGGRKTDLVVIRGNLNAQRYIDEVLRPVVVPFLRQNPGMLMHDNARPHTARVTANYLARHGVNVLPWPAFSPDINPSQVDEVTNYRCAAQARWPYSILNNLQNKMN